MVRLCVVGTVVETEEHNKCTTLPSSTTAGMMLMSSIGGPIKRSQCVIINNTDGPLNTCCSLVK